MSETLPELKPCPFCGSKDIRQEKVVGWGTTVFFTCDSCKTSGPMCFDENDAIAAWNARTADKLIERLRKALEFYARFFRLERDILSWPDTVQKWRWTGDTAEETGGPIVAREALDAEKTNTTND